MPSWEGVFVVCYVQRKKRRKECVCMPELGSIYIAKEVTNVNSKYAVCVCGKVSYDDDERMMENRKKKEVRKTKPFNNAKYPNSPPPKKKSKNTPLNTYISCGRRTLAMIRLLSRTFSNRNQIVTSFLKLLDRMWEDLMSVKTFFSVSNNSRKKKEKRDLHAGI